MKANSHPQWNHQAKVTCACGATFLTGSTIDTIQVDICSQCHPFFTGEMKFVDIQGRVEKFKSRQQAAASKAAKKTKKKDEAKPPADLLSLKDLLKEEKIKLSQTQ